MAQPPKKPVVKKPTPKPTPKPDKLPPVSQKSIDTAAKMDYEDVDLLKKAKGGKVCAKAKGGKVKFDFAKMIADKKKNEKGKKK